MQPLPNTHSYPYMYAAPQQGFQAPVTLSQVPVTHVLPAPPQQPMTVSVPPMSVPQPVMHQQTALTMAPVPQPQVPSLAPGQGYYYVPPPVPQQVVYSVPPQPQPQAQPPLVTAFSEAPRPTPKAVDAATATQLLVNFVAEEVSPGMLADLFAEHGTVDLVRMIKDKPTGQRRGYGFVYYHTPEDAQRGLAALDGADFHGKTLRVSVAVPQKPLSRRALTSVAFHAQQRLRREKQNEGNTTMSDTLSSTSSVE